MATATYDLTTAAYPGNFMMEKSGVEAIESRSRIIDGTTNGLVAGSYKLFYVPALSTLINGWVVVLTTGGDTSTIALGDATTADVYRSAAVSGAAGTVVAFTPVPATYTAENEIQITIADATFSGKIMVVLEYLPADKKQG